MNLSSTQRSSICIIALSPIYRDARVLRQIEFLAPIYDLTVVGYGPPHATWGNDPRVTWVSVPETYSPSQIKADLKHLRLKNAFGGIVSQLRRGLFYCALRIGRFWPRLYDFCYRMRWRGVRPLEQALNRHHDAYHANDWDTVPLAAGAARRQGAKLVVDLHEYAPLQWENRPDWYLNEGLIRNILELYAPDMDATITVAKPLADQYHIDFGYDPVVVMNAPRKQSAPDHEVDPQDIRIIHHGMASLERRPTLMIDTIALADEQYSLHFMFVENDYVEELRSYAQQHAPGRVFFHPPVAPEEIVPQIAAYDISFNLMTPINFNHRNALPNKFLEGIVAGLASIIGPSPSMATIIREYDIGKISNSFEPRDMADLLNSTSPQEWRRLRTNARSASELLNAETEMGKVVDLYAWLLDETPVVGKPDPEGSATHA